MSEEAETSQKGFLDLLAELHITDVLYNRENLSLSFLLEPPCEVKDEQFLTEWFHAEMRSHRPNRIEERQDRDLDGVKHFKYSDLEAFTHDVKQESVIGKNMFGRFLSAKIQQDSGILKNVLIKTWDVLFPITAQFVFLNARRLYEQIILLTKEPMRSDPYVPKLIGYSIDKQLAVLYDLEAKTTLRDALIHGNLGWDVRLKVAVQVAHLMKNFHGKNIKIGSIDPTNILIDEEGNIKLCEFGLCPSMQEVKREDKVIKWVSGGIYTLDIPEFKDGRGGKWTVETNIFAFGDLLTELISKEALDFTAMGSLSTWALKVLGSGETSRLHEFLVDDEDLSSKITEVVMNCLNEAPDQRWKADRIARKLEDIKAGSESKKPRVT